MSPQPILPLLVVPVSIEAVPVAELVKELVFMKLVVLVCLVDIVADVAIALDML